jgi:hypothetical protein
MYPPRQRQIPGVVSLGLTLILLGILLAVVSLARLQITSAGGHRLDAAAPALHLAVRDDAVPPVSLETR